MPASRYRRAERERAAKRQRIADALECWTLRAVMACTVAAAVAFAAMAGDYMARSMSHNAQEIAQ